MQKALGLAQRADERMGIGVSEAPQAVACREVGDLVVWVHAVERRAAAGVLTHEALKYTRQAEQRRVAAGGRRARLRIEPDDVLGAQRLESRGSDRGQTGLGWDTVHGVGQLILVMSQK